jgi:hypothetical protein
VVDKSLAKALYQTTLACERAVFRGHDDVFKVLVEHCSGQTAWVSHAAYFTVQEERIEMLQYLLAANDADSQRQADYQDAMECAFKHEEGAAKILVTAGAKMDARTGHPVHKIFNDVLLADTENLKVHLNEVFDPTVHRRAFIQAIMLPDTSVLSLLLDHGIGLDCVDDALFKVCDELPRTSDLDTPKARICWLLHHGASINHRALDVVSCRWNEEMLNWLLKICMQDLDKAITSMVEHQ